MYVLMLIRNLNNLQICKNNNNNRINTKGYLLITQNTFCQNLYKLSAIGLAYSTNYKLKLKNDGLYNWVLRVLNKKKK